jgi:hypothetical protein
MMAKKKSAAKAASVPVEVHKHVADTRPNIPTREMAAFAATAGPHPFVVHRDRSLDPQLVWKGKDEQDARPLGVSGDRRVEPAQDQAGSSQAAEGTRGVIHWKGR